MNVNWFIKYAAIVNAKDTSNCDVKQSHICDSAPPLTCARVPDELAPGEGVVHLVVDVLQGDGYPALEAGACGEE